MFFKVLDQTGETGAHGNHRKPFEVLAPQCGHFRVVHLQGVEAGFGQKSSMYLRFQMLDIAVYINTCLSTSSSSSSVSQDLIRKKIWTVIQTNYQQQMLVTHLLFINWQCEYIVEAEKRCVIIFISRCNVHHSLGVCPWLRVLWPGLCCRLLETDSKSLRSMNGSRRNSGSSLVSSSSASSNLSHLEEDSWILWGRIVNEWEEVRKKKEKQLKVRAVSGRADLQWLVVHSEGISNHFIQKCFTSDSTSPKNKNTIEHP